jgi:prevent-host-death family protein
MSRTVNIHEAKTHLSRLVEEAAGGDEVIIARAGRPVARLVPLERKPKPKKLGLLKGQFRVPVDFNEPLPPGAMDSFENG